MSQAGDRNELQKLHEKLRILELENDRLAERAEETLLLGLISEKIRSSGDTRELIESGLEQISILKDIAFGASCYQRQNRFEIQHGYCSHATCDLEGEYLELPTETIGPIANDSYILDPDDCKRIISSPGLENVMQPASLILIPLTSAQGRDFYFIFADNRPDMDFSELRFLLHRALDIMVSRIDNLDLLEKLTALNLHLDMKVTDRTSDLQAANETLQREVTERNTAELALKASESRFRSLAENAFDAIFILDENLCFMDLNERACLTLGYEREDLLGMSLSRILVEENPEFGFEIFGVDNDTSVFTREESFLCKNGAILPVETRMAMIHVDGRPHLMVQSRDVSEQKALEEQLLQSRKMEAVGRLAGGIAHDFNNILMTIIGHVDLTLMDLPENHPIRPDIITIGEAGEKASQLTRQLLAFSRKEVVAMSPLNLNGNISDMSTMLRRVIGEDIELIIDLNSECGNIKADPGKIEQILMNLVINARDAMPDGGQIRITTRLMTQTDTPKSEIPEAEDYSGNQIILSLSDTGTGIDPDILDNIFDPFFSTKDSTKGTGLGLSTVYGLTQQHNASISVDSVVGEGTRFDIVFKEINSHIEAPIPQAVQQAPGGNELILLVEDDDAIRDVFSTMLTKLGYSLLIARDGIEALEIVSKNKKRIDLALTDVIMPRMNGRLLVERLNRIQSDMKVIYMSGYTDDMIGQHGVLEEGTNFLQKPISFLKLAISIRAVLDSS